MNWAKTASRGANSRSEIKPNTFTNEREGGITLFVKRDKSQKEGGTDLGSLCPSPPEDVEMCKPGTENVEKRYKPPPKPENMEKRRTKEKKNRNREEKPPPGKEIKTDNLLTQLEIKRRKSFKKKNKEKCPSKCPVTRRKTAGGCRSDAGRVVFSPNETGKKKSRRPVFH